MGIQYKLIKAKKSELKKHLDKFGIPENKRKIVMFHHEQIGYAVVELDTDNYVYLCQSEQRGHKPQIALCQETQ